MKDIADFSEHLDCPTVDGIIYPNGRIQLCDFEVNWGKPISYIKTATTETSINTLEKEGDLWWNSCGILATEKNLELAIEVISGEGNYGSDGFIGVLDETSRKLIWLAFFTSSNPFNKIKILNNEIQARSTLDCLWTFKLKNPSDFSIQCF